MKQGLHTHNYRFVKIYARSAPLYKYKWDKCDCTSVRVLVKRIREATVGMICDSTSSMGISVECCR